MIPSAPFRDDAGAVDRTVFYDERVDAGWQGEGPSIVDTLVLRGGYRHLTAKDLDDWLDLRIKSGADGAILINLHGKFIGRIHALRQFMRAGGRLVWIGFPNYAWGITYEDLPAHNTDPAHATDAGKTWGLRRGRYPGRYGVVPLKDAGLTLIRQGDRALSFFRNFDPDKPQSGLLKIWRHGIEADGSVIEEVMRVAAHGIGPAKLAEPLRSEEPELEPKPVEPGVVFVGSGTFKIARSRALEKLMTYQLAGKDLHLLPAMRAAVAAGAKTVRVETSLRSVSLSHGGRPLDEAFVRDPFRALFTETEDAAATQTAIAALNAFGSGASRVEVESGGRLCEVRGPDDLRPGESQAGGSRFSVRWSALDWRGMFPALRAAKALRKAARTGRVKLLINGSEVRPAPAGSKIPSLAFENKGLRGEIQGGPVGTFGSKFEAHYLGVRCCRLENYTHPSSFVGWLDSDAWTLNMSQSGIVRDEVFDKQLELLVEPSRRLVETTFEEYRPLMREAARLVHAHGLEPVWRRHSTYEHRSHYGGAGDFLRWPLLLAKLLQPGMREAFRKTARAAYAVWWLRSNGSGDDPLWFAADGSTLTKSRIKELAKKRGKTCMTTKRNGGENPAETLWLVSSGDIRLSEGLGGKPPEWV